MIDLHAHILPNVDDGAHTFEESIDIIKYEIEQGVTDIVVTPHCFAKETKTSRAFQIEQYEKLVEMTKDLNIRLYLGAEIFYHSHIDLELDTHTLDGTNLVLIEFDPAVKTNIEEIVYNIQAKGFQVVVAHVERYFYLSKADLIKIRKTGALLQVNSSAIMGHDHHTKKSIVSCLIKNKLIDVVASDTHNLDRRPPMLKEAYQKLKKYYKKEELDLLFNRINFQID